MTGADAGATVPSDWGIFTRSTTTLTNGEVLVHEAFSTASTPQLILATPDAAEAAALLPALSPFMTDAATWTRRATDAVVHRFSEEEPTPGELDDAATDLVVAAVEVRPGGDVQVHLDDTCGEHFLEGYWPAVRFPADGSEPEVTVES